MHKNELRHQFEHYIPTTWSIEIHVIPQICIDVLEAVRFLALDTGNVRLMQTQKKKVKSLVSRSRRILKQSELYKLYGEYSEQQIKSKSSVSAAIAKIFKF